jgi:hypothetical protein
MRSRIRFSLLTLFVIGYSITAWAQVERGTLACSIIDSSGSDVPGAEIAVVNVDTGVEFRTVSNDQGDFVAPNLIPGRYRVTVSKTGFKSLHREDLIVRANERLAVTLTLDVGVVTQVVDVRGDVTPLLSKESSTVTSHLDSQQVAELPTLNRTIFDLASVLPGVTIANIQSNSIGIPDNARIQMGLTANGGGSGGSGSSSLINNFMLDGVNNTMVSATSSYLGINPPLEAIQEFTIDTSNATAEQGRGGTSIRVVLKSGTNKFHGSAFEFLRNAALDARNYFDYEDLSGSTRRLPNFVQNQFGGTLGGPIRKDKTFFFADYQGFRQREGRTWISNVPDAAVRAGDFSGTSQPIFDPATWNPASGTRQPFAGDMIPQNRFSPAAVNVMTYMPLPNGAGLNALGIGNFYSSSTLSRTQDTFDAKIDHQISAKDSIAGRFSWGRSYALLPGAYTDLPQFAPAQGGALQQQGADQFLPGTVSNPSAQAALQWLHNINPTTINEAHISWLRSGANAQVLGHGHNYGDTIGIPNANVDEINSGFPGQTITGVTYMGEGGAYPEINIENSYQVLDNATFIRGSHTYKVGVDLKRLHQTFLQLLGGTAGGSFNYDQYLTGNPNNPGSTGNAMASFLLGLPASASLSRLKGTAGMEWWEASFFAQDTWKVTRKLTFNYGLRYEAYTPEVEQFNRISNFDLGSGLLVLPDTKGTNPGLSTRALVSGNYGGLQNFEPRLGLAYQVTPKTVLRAGFADHSALGIGKAFGFMALNSPFSGGTSYFNTATPQQIVRTLDEGFPTTQPFNPLSYTGPLVWAADPNGAHGYMAQWSAGIQRELASNLSLEVNYVGNSAPHIMGLMQPNTATLGNGPYPQRTPFYATDPNAPTILYWVWRERAHYDALQTTLTKRFSGGLSFGAAFTWSHNLGTVEPAQGNVPNIMENTAIDARLRLATNWLWEIPFGRGKKYGQNISPVVDAIAGGWRFGGVVAFQSGSPFTVNGYAGNPDRICNGQTPPGGHTVTKWFDTSCFVPPPTLTDPVYGGTYFPYGNSGYNILTGDGVRQNDLSLAKFFNIGEAGRIEFRAEFFNFVNNPQFLPPLSNVQAGNAGLVTAANPARQIQLALKYSF